MLIKIINRARALNYMNAKEFVIKESGWEKPGGGFVGTTKLDYCGKTFEVDMDNVPRSPYKFQIGNMLFQGWFIDES